MFKNLLVDYLLSQKTVNLVKIHEVSVEMKASLLVDAIYENFMVPEKVEKSLKVCEKIKN